MKRCPKCKNELITHKSDSRIDLSGLLPSEAKQFRKRNEVIYYFCDECTEYFLFLPSKIYVYNGSEWELFGIEPEQVIFT